ncbi:hotdog fold thioesterase [bacterium]|nr:hotdog fold thioesterase [bacterium]
MALDALARRWEGIPYCAALGVRVDAIERDRVRLRLPFADENSNPGRALHGGVSASLIDVAGALAAWTGVEDRPGLEASTLDLSVNYLAAAIGEEVIASAEVLRRGKELAYSQVDVRSAVGKRIAVGMVTYRVFDHAANPVAAERQRSATESGGAAGEKIRGADLFVTSPFIARLGMTVAAAHGGESVLVMPAAPASDDGAGAAHEGAVAALIDTTGALAAWSLVGLDMRFKASTLGIHVNFHAPARGDLRAHARTLRRNNEIFLNQVAVSAGGDVVATGAVTYRIVVD